MVAVGTFMSVPLVWAGILITGRHPDELDNLLLALWAIGPWPWIYSCVGLFALFGTTSQRNGLEHRKPVLIILFVVIVPASLLFIPSFLYVITLYWEHRIYLFYAEVLGVCIASYLLSKWIIKRWFGSQLSHLTHMFPFP